MDIVSFALDPVRNAPLIILKESGGERTLPVPIGHNEASAIAIKSLNVVTDKPLTIDLVKVAIEALGAMVERIVIEDGGEKGFSTRLHLASAGGVLVIECSTSDGISLALRCASPVYVNEEILNRRQEGESPAANQTLGRWIAAMDTVEFGRYYLE